MRLFQCPKKLKLDQKELIVHLMKQLGNTQKAIKMIAIMIETY